jgi:hypothetical protein
VRRCGLLRQTRRGRSQAKNGWRTCSKNRIDHRQSMFTNPSGQPRRRAAPSCSSMAAAGPASTKAPCRAWATSLHVTAMSPSPSTIASMRTARTHGRLSSTTCSVPCAGYTPTHQSTNHIGAFGHSAGGQLAALLGMEDTRDNSDHTLANYSSRVQAVVDFSDPPDFTERRCGRWIELYK